MEISNDLLELLQKGEIISSDFKQGDQEIFNLLVNARVLVNDDNTELLKIKRHINALRHHSDYASFTILPTLDCNFACPYCFEKKRKTTLTEDSMNKISKLINHIISHTQGCNLTWFGGEPLLAINKIEQLYNKLDVKDKHIHASIITNGYLLSKANIAKLKKLHISSVQITLDGLENTHNTRKFVSGKHLPTFQRILKNIIELHNENFANISIRVNVDDNNKHEFIPLYQYLSNAIPNFGDNLYVYPAFINPHGQDICQNNNICHLSHLKQIEFIYHLYEKYGYVHSAIYPNNTLYECPIRHVNSWVIGPDATLYKCWEIAGDKDFEIGCINEDGIPVITNEQILFRYLEGADPFTDPTCMNCNLYPVCGGGCIQSRIKNKYLDTNINHCIFAKDNIEGFLKIYYQQYKKTQRNEMDKNIDS
jgi:uncharacterized protein